MNLLRSHLLVPVRFAVQLHKLVFLAAANAAVGGQAVMEGVMMRGPNHWAIAIRRRNGEIVEIHRTHTALGRRYRWARLPVVRGVIALGESLAIGFRALSVSAHYAAEWYDEDDHVASDAVPSSGAGRAQGPGAAGGDAGSNVVPIDSHRHGHHVGEHAAAAASVPAATSGMLAAAPLPVEHVEEVQQPGADAAEVPVEATPESLSRLQIAVAFVFAIGFSVLLFKLLPAALTNFALVKSDSPFFVFVEASVRISIFCVYLFVIGLMPDMRRVFQYHSAEHKAINAWEKGVELTPEAVNRESRIHVRCGTAFMLWVFVVGILVFGVFGYYVQPTIWEVLGSRVLLLPLIAGLSFELIKFAGAHRDNTILRTMLAPGLWLQRLTTRECDEAQCEVAIRSLRIVLQHEFPESSDTDALRKLESDDEAMQVMA